MDINKPINLLMTFVFCIFMGITAISIGFGALFPSINLIAKPFVCPGGEMDVVQQVYRPYPGTTITTLTWYCTNAASGERKEMSILLMSLIAGTIYGLLLFAVVYVGMAFLGTRRGSAGAGTNDQVQQLVERAEQIRKQTEDFRESASGLRESKKKIQASGSALAKMKELKELRDANMISEAEYEKKRSKILEDL